MTSPAITTFPVEIDKRYLNFVKRWYITALALGIFVFSLFSLNALAKNLPTQDSTLVILANQDRASQNLPALKTNRELQRAAEAKAKDMFKNQYFEHISPQGKTPWDFITASGYHYTYAGENLAMDFTDLNATNKAWMASPTHRANLLDPHYQEVGIASVGGELNGHQTIITVEMFGTSTLDSILNVIKPSK